METREDIIKTLQEKFWDLNSVFIQEAIEKAYNLGHSRGFEAGEAARNVEDADYQDGKEDGFMEILKVIRDIYQMTPKERQEYFNRGYFFSTIELDANRLVEGHKAWAADKERVCAANAITIGTEVTWEDNGKKLKGAVYLIDQNDDCHIMSKDDDYIVGIECLKPTGRHYPEISNVLRIVSIEDGGEDD